MSIITKTGQIGFRKSRRPSYTFDFVFCFSVSAHGTVYSHLHQSACPKLSIFLLPRKQEGHKCQIISRPQKSRKSSRESSKRASEQVAEIGRGHTALITSIGPTLTCAPFCTDKPLILSINCLRNTPARCNAQD